MAEHLYKTFELKANDWGTIEGYFSTYDKTPDSYGDIIEPGAFTDTLKAREESGHPFPLCFNHDFSAVIGAVKSVKDTEKGPFIEAEFLDTTLAQDVRKMLLSGAIYQFSFAYDVLGRRDPNEEEKKAGITNVLTKLEVFEISVVTVPANQNAVATEVKTLKAEEVKNLIIETEKPDAMLVTAEGVKFIKQGRRNRKADEDLINDTVKQLNSCIAALKSLLDDSDDNKPTEDEATEEKAEPKANAVAEEPKASGNSKRAEAILEKLKRMEVPNYDN